MSHTHFFGLGKKGRNIVISEQLNNLRFLTWFKNKYIFRVYKVSSFPVSGIIVIVSRKSMVYYSLYSSKTVQFARGSLDQELQDMPFIQLQCTTKCRTYILHLPTSCIWVGSEMLHEIIGMT